MKYGVTIRNMGPESMPDVMLECARAAENAGIDSIWITDHLAIPPDDSEGSGGRYVDPLITLAWLANGTSRIQLGTGVLILPYRDALVTAKQVASLQELSGERLLLGVGIGWMDAEFRAVGVDRHRRGRISDDALKLLNQCFGSDVSERYGQKFIFRPRPRKPPVYVGGSAPHALRRAAQYGDGWLPMGLKVEEVEHSIQSYEQLTARFGRARGSINVMGGLPLNNRSQVREQIEAYDGAGIDSYICNIRYKTIDDYHRQLDSLASAIK